MSFEKESEQHDVCNASHVCQKEQECQGVIPAASCVETLEMAGCCQYASELTEEDVAVDAPEEILFCQRAVDVVQRPWDRPV